MPLVIGIYLLKLRYYIELELRNLSISMTLLGYLYININIYRDLINIFFYDDSGSRFIEKSRLIFLKSATHVQTYAPDFWNGSKGNSSYPCECPKIIVILFCTAYEPNLKHVCVSVPSFYHSTTMSRSKYFVNRRYDKIVEAKIRR